MKWENQQEAASANSRQLLKQQNSKELLKLISSKWKLIKIEKKYSEIRRKGGHSWQSEEYTFDIFLKTWMLSPFSYHYRNMATIIVLGSLIHPLTDQVERPFSLMKIICTWLRNRFLTENLSHYMRICKFRDLRADEYEQILRLWLKTDETKNRKRKFHHDYNDKFFIYICLIFLSSMFLFFDKPCLKRKRYLQWPHVMLRMQFTTFSPHEFLLQWKIFWHLSPHHGVGSRGEGLALGETELS